MPRRIVLFTRDAGLTVALRGLLPTEDRVLQFESPDGRPGELDPAADTLVLDLPADLRRGAYRSIREWFTGRVVVLLVPGERDRSFDGDKACRVLYRPFQLDDLLRELVVPPRADGRRGGVFSGRHQAGATAPPPAGDLPVRPRPAAPTPPPAVSGPPAGPRAGTAPQPPAAGDLPARPRPGTPSPPAAAGDLPARPRPGTAPPPAAGAPGARFPGRVDLPSRTASPGTPEKVPQDELDPAAAPGERPPLLFDWFAAHGRRTEEPAADPPDNEPSRPTRRSPLPGELAPAAGREPPPGPAGEQPPAPDLGRLTDRWRPLAALGKQPADPRQPAEPTRTPPADDPGRRADPRRADEPTGQAPTAPDPGWRTDPRRPPESTQEHPVPPSLGPPVDRQRPVDAAEAPPPPPGLGRRVDPRRFVEPTGEGPAADPERAVDPRRPEGSTKEGLAAADPGRPGESTGPAPAVPGPGRPGDPAAASGVPEGPSGTEEEDGQDLAAGVVARGKGLPKRVVDLRRGVPRPRAGRRPAEDTRVAAERAATPPTRPEGVTGDGGAVAPSTGWAVAGQPGERVRAPFAEGWAGPAPAYARVLVAVLLGSVAVLVSGLFSSRSPEIGAGEAAIAQVARSAAGGTGIAWHGQPVLDQPPLALVAHAGWLLASGRADAELVQTVQHARLSSSGFRGLAVALLVLLVLALTERRRDTLLRFAVATAAGLVAALDPVLAGAGRVLTVESVGLAAGLAVLLLAWLLQERRAAVFVPVVGLASGAALLADGRSLVLLLVPLGFALLARGEHRVAGLAGRALAALLVGVGFWAAFAAWVARAPGGGGLGQRLERVAALAHLTPADRPLPLSRPLDLVLPRDLATLAVLLLAVPALLAVWRRGERAGRFLAAWNLAGLGAGVLLDAAGALDESWLAYLVPGAVAAVALGLGAFRDLLAGQGAWPRRVATVTISLAVLALLVGGGLGWEGRYGRSDDATAHMATLVATKTPACSALSAGNPADADLFAVGERRVASFPDGPTALASGVRWFLLRGDQAAAGDLAGWLSANGRQVASVPSPSNGTMRLWAVQQPSTSRVADLRRVDGGAFENVVGSACGGFSVLDGAGARFWSSYQAIGGKGVVGRPLSRPWRDGARSLQAFDTMILGSVPAPGGGQPLARPVDLLTRLTRQAPALLAAAGLPKAETAPPPTIPQRRRLLAEPTIARFYLGVEPAAANPAIWQLAAARFGAPVSPPRRLPGGVVRQAFEDVVLEADAQGAVRLAPLGTLAARAGLIPAAALRPEPVPGLPPPGSRYPAVHDLDLGLHMAAALGLWALLALGLAVRAGLRHDRAPAPATPGPPPPPPSADPGPVGASSGRRAGSQPAPAGEERAT